MTESEFTHEEILAAQRGLIMPPVGLQLRPYREIIADLSQKIPEQFLKVRDAGGGNKLTYWPWWVGYVFMNKYAPGWEWRAHDPVFSNVVPIDEVVKDPSDWKKPPIRTGNVIASAGHVAIVGDITIRTIETGWQFGITRSGEGGDYENASAEKAAKGFDPVLDAARQAYKRAMSQLGLGFYLYLDPKMWPDYFAKLSY